MATVFLPLSTQETIFLLEKFVFAFSISLSTLSMVLLVKQTPPNQATIRNYLIAIQVFVILTDWELGLLTEAIILFPVWGGYCCGLLCQHVMSGNIMFGSVVFLLANIGISIVLCCLYRHQSILRVSKLKLRKCTLQLVRITLIVFFNSGPILIMLRKIDPLVVEQNVDEAGLGWLRERNCEYLIERRSDQLLIACYVVIGVLFCFSSFVLLAFGHMFYVLHKDVEKRSSQSVSRIRKSLRILFVQLIIPLSLIVLPATLCFLSAVNANLFRFEFVLAMYEVIKLHSIGHNIILLTITSTYRKIIMKFIPFRTVPSRVHMFVSS